MPAFNGRFALAAVSLAFILFLFLCACRGGSHKPFDIAANPAAQTQSGSPDAARIAATLPEIAEEVKELTPAEHHDATVLENLKDAFIRELLKTGKQRFVSQAPQGARDAIDDLSLAPDGGGGFELTWTYRNTGDYDMNGVVGVSDITPIALNYLAPVPGGGTIEAWIDGDGSGQIGVSDITPIALNYLTAVAGYKVFGGATDGGPWEEIGFVDFGDGERNVLLSFGFPVGAAEYPSYRVAPVDFEGAEGAGGALAQGASPFTDFLRISPGDVMTEVETDVVFTIAVASGAVSVSSVELFLLDGAGEPADSLGQMFDDGLEESGDEFAMDGVYSLKLPVSAPEAGLDEYRVYLTFDAGAGERTVKSNAAGLTFYDDMTEERAQEIIDFLDSVETDFRALAATGLELQDAAVIIADSISGEPEVAASGTSESGQGVWWVTPDGVPCAVTLYDEDVQERSGGAVAGIGDLPPPFDPGEPPAVKPKNHDCVWCSPERTVSEHAPDGKNRIKNTNAIFLAAFNDEFAPYDEVPLLFEKFKEKTCPDFGEALYKNAECDIFKFKDLENYGIIVISTHGDSYFKGYPNTIWEHNGANAQVATLTREKVTKAKVRTYLNDLKAGRILLCGSVFAISPKFVRDHCKGMPNSIVYLGQCRGTFNDTMVNAFLAAGAGTVIGYSDYVQSDFCKKWGEDLFHKLLDGKTTGEAFTPGQVETDADPARFDIRGSQSLLMTGGQSGIHNLGVLDPSLDNTPGIYSWGRSVNNSGQVAGETYAPTGEAPELSGFFWRDGEMVEIPRLGGLYVGGHCGLNDSGMVVGTLVWQQGIGSRGFYWTEGGGTELLGTIDGDVQNSWSNAHDINSAGIIVGKSSVPSDNMVFAKGVYFQGGSITAVDPWGTGIIGNSAESTCLKITDNNLILGAATDYEEFGGATVGFILPVGGEKAKLYYEIDAGTSVYAGNAINSSGTVVGGNWYDKAGNNSLVGSIYKGGIVTEIGRIDENSYGAKAYAINSKGEIVGELFDPENGNDPWRAFIYRNGRVEWLENLLPCDSGWYLRAASDISDTGYVTGHGWYGQYDRGFLMKLP